jgi:hypothetical protein
MSPSDDQIQRTNRRVDRPRFLKCSPVWDWFSFASSLAKNARPSHTHRAHRIPDGDAIPEERKNQRTSVKRLFRRPRRKDGNRESTRAFARFGGFAGGERRTEGREEDNGGRNGTSRNATKTRRKNIRFKDLQNATLGRQAGLNFPRGGFRPYGFFSGVDP